PVNRVATIQRVGKTRARLEQRFRRVPNPCELAAEMGISEEEVLHTIRVETTHASLDAPVAYDSGSPLAEFVTDDRQARPDDMLSESSLTRSVDLLLSQLTEREESVVRLYFGIGEETSHTLDEIAQRFEITRERVRQIKKMAIGKLKGTHEATMSNVFS
ncbi:MAG: sigma-70 family RNA polymerase sigma factor, partial [Chitinivibrionales bacterium]|nr:sigma-70 family RNA polymerase sigma factor [Chitinivibrionales bacterium]